MSALTGPRTRKRHHALGALVLTLLGGLLGPLAATSAASFTSRLAVSVTGSFQDAVARGQQSPVVTGTVASSTDTATFTLTASCILPTGLACSTLSLTTASYQWSFSDGVTRTTSLNTTTRSFTSPGVYRLDVATDLVRKAGTSSATYYTGHGTLTIVVSPRYADADKVGTTPGSGGVVKSQADGDSAAWTVSAYGLMGPCRSYISGTSPLAGSLPVDAGRAEFCPSVPDRLAATSPSSEISTNGVTGVGCTANWWSCGIPASAIASASGGDPQPQAGCAASCQKALGAIDILHGVNRLYSPADCSDNVTLQPAVHGTTRDTQLVRGTEAGCMNYRDYLSALVKAVDDPDNPAPVSTPAPTKYRTNIISNTTLATASDWTLSAQAKPTMSVADASISGSSAGRAITLTQSGGANNTSSKLLAALSVPALDAGQTYTLSLWARSLSGATSGFVAGIDDTDNPMPLSAFDLTSSWERYDFSFIAPATTTAQVSVTLPSTVAYSMQIASPMLQESADATGWFARTRTSVCPSGPEPSRDTIRAYDLWASTHVDTTTLAALSVNANLPVVRLCDTDAALTKTEAYLLADAAGQLPDSSSVTTTLRDLVNVHLDAAPTWAGADWRPSVGAALTAGAPLVGSITCPDSVTQTASRNDPGWCFNGPDSMTRIDTARLLAGLVSNQRNTQGTAGLSVTASRTRVPLGSPVQLDVSVTVPVFYPATTQVTLTPPDDAALGGRLVCPVVSGIAGANRSVSFSCRFTPSLGSDGSAVVVTFNAAMTFSTAAGQVTSNVTGAGRIVLANSAPVLKTPYFPDSMVEADSSVRIVIPWTDAEESDIYVGVRSCDPATQTCTTSAATFPETSRTRTLGGVDTDPATFSSTAQSELGAIKVTGHDAQTITLTLTPSSGDVFGSFDVVVLVCDTGNACTKRLVTTSLDPVNDAPAADALTSVRTTDSAPVEFTLGGSDTHDDNRGGYAASISAWRIDTVPDDGTLYYKSQAGTWTAVTAGAQLPAIGLKWVPSGNGGTTNATYSVLDAGWPAPGLWSPASAAGTLRLSDSVAPVAKVNVAPATGAAFTGVLSADASGSSSSGGTTLTGYVFTWGDGATTTSTSSSATHRYTNTSAASYSVSVKVTDSSGRTATSSTASYSSLRNYLANGTFETDNSGWTGQSGSTLAGDSSARGSGSSRAMLVGTGTGGLCQVTTSASSLTSGTQQVSVWVKAGSGGSGQTVTLSAADNASQPVTTTASATLSSTWKQLTLSHLLGSGASSLTLTLKVTGASSGACMSVDDAAIAK